ncbi:HTH-type transcriptional activator RhaR [Ephemeroptericola cinctiostellae]|uniref:HTH-type transcriptional activator RhaR n=1 Tax=Ephemeroptericola cinctiostellae TaxID=2268024 RepID=A0A345DCB8_9BURK|nr:4-hydroxyphenylacetate catabolism regulatory protein HpaA [Ephemeroptericola cinctiostellae]AXF86006.1 HTH-type transcriptional activator RhaR [Ephemeroptericola cinctiostellae]
MNPIPNINLGEVYDTRYESSEVHYECFSKLAHFFGRNMPVHWHDRFFQIHFLSRGQMHLQLDEKVYRAHAPLFVMTPPSVPHAFVTGDDAEGHVLTVTQNWIWPLLTQLYPGQKQEVVARAACIELCPLSDEALALERLWLLMAYEASEVNALKMGVSEAMRALTQLLWIDMHRLMGQGAEEIALPRVDVRLFRQFNQLVERDFMTHESLKHYAEHMSITEARLNDVCQRISGMSPKALIHDRLLRECKQMLLYSPLSIQELAYHLGFKDPSYFSRFFSKSARVSPSVFRENKRSLG